MHTEQRAEHEAAIARAFIRPHRRSRFLELAGARKIAQPGTLGPNDWKRRSRYATMLANFEHWFDPRCGQLPFETNDPHAEARSRLARLGVSWSVYVMSEDAAIDGRETALTEVFSYLATTPSYGTLVVCGEHRAAYYEQCELAALTRLVLAIGSRE